MNCFEGSWDEMSRWAAGRYQLLVLSTHYQNSSEHLVNYIKHIERKVSQSSDEMPECIIEKIRLQSNKAKVFKQMLQFSNLEFLEEYYRLYCFIMCYMPLVLNMTICHRSRGCFTDCLNIERTHQPCTCIGTH